MSMTREIEQLIGAVDQQNDALRRGEFGALRDASDETRRLAASLEEGVADGQRLVPHRASALLRRLRRVLDVNTELLTAARQGAEAACLGGAVAYDASGRPLTERSSVALTPRSPKQL